MISYRVTLEPDDNGALLVTSPDFPVITYGEDHAQALHQAVDAVEAIIASLMSAGEAIPSSSTEPCEGIVLPLQTTLKVELHLAMREAGLTRADLKRRLGWQRESVDRLLRLDHKSRIAQIEEAFRAIGKAVSVEIREVA